MATLPRRTRPASVRGRSGARRARAGPRACDSRWGGARGEREDGPGERSGRVPDGAATWSATLAPPDGLEDAERDEVPVRRRMRHVARGQEDRRGVAPAHRAQVGRRPRQREGPGRALTPLVGRYKTTSRHAGSRWRSYQASTRPPWGGSRVNRHVLDQAVAHDPDPPSVAQGLSILAARPHGAGMVHMAVVASSSSRDSA